MALANRAISEKRVWIKVQDATGGTPVSYTPRLLASPDIPATAWEYGTDVPWGHNQSRSVPLAILFHGPVKGKRAKFRFLAFDIGNSADFGNGVSLFRGAYKHSMETAWSSWANTVSLPNDTGDAVTLDFVVTYENSGVAGADQSKTAGCYVTACEEVKDQGGIAYDIEVEFVEEWTTAAA